MEGNPRHSRGALFGSSVVEQDAGWVWCCMLQNGKPCALAEKCLTLMLPRWKIMATEPDLPMDSLRRSISVRTRSMKAVRSLLTPLLLASTASALHPKGSMVRVDSATSLSPDRLSRLALVYSCSMPMSG